MPSYQAPAFLTELLHARSPSGYESEAQAVFDRHVQPAADSYAKDALGNRVATLNPSGDPVLMLAGHMDELGLIITYVNKDGYLYFDTIGGHDRTVISGRRVIIQGRRARAEFDLPAGIEAVVEQLPLLDPRRRATDEQRREHIQYAWAHAETQPRLTLFQPGRRGTLRLEVRLILNA